MEFANDRLPSPPSRRWRVHWVTCELNARGEIDAHTTMCLRFAIDGARPGSTEMICVDLRDLTAIDASALQELTDRNAHCHARGMALALLISGHERHDQIAEALVLAGLGDTLQYTHEPFLPVAAPPIRLVGSGHRVHRGRLVAAARRWSQHSG